MWFSSDLNPQHRQGQRNCSILPKMDTAWHGKGRAPCHHPPPSGRSCNVTYLSYSKPKGDLYLGHLLSTITVKQWTHITVCNCFQLITDNCGPPYCLCISSYFSSSFTNVLFLHRYINDNWLFIQQISPFMHRSLVNEEKRKTGKTKNLQLTFDLYFVSRFISMYSESHVKGRFTPCSRKLGWLTLLFFC